MVESTCEIQATLTCDTTCDGTQIEDQKHEIKIPWGRLRPCDHRLNGIDLLDESYTFGRTEDCDISIGEGQPKTEFLLISKQHFQIYKEPAGPAYITDFSKNGTYLNQRLVGKDNTNILQHEDVISLGNKNFKCYVYTSHNIDEQYLPKCLRKKYQIWDCIGKGAAGEVRLVYEKTTCIKYAVKRIIKSSTSNIYQMNHPQKIKTEIEILQQLSHPCIIGMKEIMETDKEVFIILDYMEGGELTNRILSINTMTESNIKFIFYQIVLAVQYLHQNGIAHRDLKPENVLLLNENDETLVKISDFGLSKIMEERDFMTTLCGTLTYIAPEILVSNSEYSVQVDVWSLGVILYYMVCTEYPFFEKERNKLCQLIVKGKYSFNDRINRVSPLAKDLIRKMLHVNPNRRITIEGILTHPWIAKDFTLRYRVNKLLGRTFGQSDIDSDETTIIDDSDDDSESSRPVKRLCTLTNAVSLNTRL